MKSINQIFLIIICVVISAYQTMAQNIANVNGPNPAESIVNNDRLSDQELIDKYKKTTVYIKNEWYLADKLTNSPVYILYVSKKTLAKAGIKYSGDAEAVPVYVKTAEGYEPILTGDKSNHNQLVNGLMSGRGSVITSDGFIMTTSRVIAPWHSTLDFGKGFPRGILVSADMKKVLDANAPPPDNWIPSQSQKRSGTLQTFNIRVKYSGEGTFKLERLLASMPETYNMANAVIVQRSIRHDVGVIKIDAPGNLDKAELLDNYNTLKKGENLFFVTQDSSAKLTEEKLAVLPFSITDFVRAAGENSDVIEVSDNLENSPTLSKVDAQVQQSFFGFYSYSGTPIFNNQGKIVGIYSSYNPDTKRHYIVPMRYGMELINNK